MVLPIRHTDPSADAEKPGHLCDVVGDQVHKARRGAPMKPRGAASAAISQLRRQSAGRVAGAWSA